MAPGLALREKLEGLRDDHLLEASDSGRRVTELLATLDREVK